MPWADFEAAGINKLRDVPGHEIVSVDARAAQGVEGVGGAGLQVMGRQRAQDRRRSRCGHEGTAHRARSVQGAVLRSGRDGARADASVQSRGVGFSPPSTSVTGRRYGESEAKPAATASPARRWHARGAAQYHGPVHRRHRTDRGVLCRHRRGRHLHLGAAALLLLRIRSRTPTTSGACCSAS